MKIYFIKLFIINSKRIIGYLLILTLLLLVLKIIFQYNYLVKNKLISSISEQYQNRELYVYNHNNPNTLQENIDKIRKIKFVEEVQFTSSSKSVLINGKNFVMEYALTNHLPRIVFGEQLESNYLNEIIIPDHIKDVFQEKEVNKLLNQYVDVEYYNKNGELKSFECKIVGIYQSAKEANGKIYVSNFNTLELEKESDIGYLVTIDKYENVDKSIDSLTKMNFSVNIYDDSLENELNIYVSLNQLFNIFVGIIIFIFSGVIFYIINDFIHMEIATIALMKAIGYSRLKILENLIFLITVLLLISYMLYLITQSIILMVASKLFGLLVHVDIVLEIILFLITIVIELIVIIIFNIKISKISIINLLKNSNK